MVWLGEGRGGGYGGAESGGGGLSIVLMFFYVNNLNSDLFFSITCTLKLQSNSIDSFHSVKLYDVFFVVVIIRIMYCSL